MGNITDQAEHDNDVLRLRMISELLPSYKRYFRHHLMNSLHVIILSTEIIRRCATSGDTDGLLQALDRIENQYEHIKADLERVNI